MKRQVVQNFLNLPGIVGIALMDGRSRPSFLGIDQILNVQQEEILAQGIQQVVATTPAGLESFSFQFVAHQVYIHKLDQGISLMVLIHPRLSHQEYQAAFEPLKRLLQTDLTAGVDTFRDWLDGTSQDDHPDGAVVSTPLAHPDLTIDPPDSLESPDSLDPPDSLASPYLAEAVDALNQLSVFTSHYLGKTIVSNTLKASCPNVPWMQQFQVNRIGEIQWEPSTDGGNSEPLTTEQCGWIQDWANGFIKKCSRIIRNYAVLLEKESFSDRQRQLLFPPNSDK